MKHLQLLTSEPMDYHAYMHMAESMSASSRTTGPNQSEAMIHYTKLNLKRMQRLNKTVAPGPAIIEALASIPFEMKWVAITEIWCGDAAQNLPYIAKLASLSPKVDLYLVLRDDNVAYMDQFLSNGSRSIPKVVMYRADDGEVVATWGPRPAEVQRKVMAYKEMDGQKPSFEQFSTEIHQWYTHNKNRELESELLAILRQLSAIQYAV